MKGLIVAALALAGTASLPNSAFPTADTDFQNICASMTVNSCWLGYIENKNGFVVLATSDGSFTGRMLEIDESGAGDISIYTGLVVVVSGQQKAGVLTVDKVLEAGGLLMTSAVRAIRSEVARQSDH